VNATVGKPLTQLQFGLTAASVSVAVLPHLLRMPWLFAVPIVLVLLGRCQQRLRGGMPIPAWIKLPLVVIFPIMIIFHFGTIFGRAPGSVLACAMLVLKLVETEKRRDARAAVCFSSFVLMSALLFDSGLGFTLALVALVFALLPDNAYRWCIAFAAIGALWLILGGIAAYMAKRELEVKGLLPKRTVEVLKEDKMWIQSEVKQI